MTNLDPLQIWKGFHWSFFVNIQGLILTLRRFEIALIANNLPNAQVELETATILILASSAAMELAGSFSKQEYEQVRKTMSPPHVQSNDFSGLMSWEHASLVKVWQILHPVFQTLPATLQPQHDQFISAYLTLATAHKAVCQKFGGGETGSLRSDKSTAVDTLDKFGQNRWRLIDPNHRLANGCPFHNNTTKH